MSYTKGEWRIDKELTDNGAPVIVSNTCWLNRKREIAKALYAFGSEDPEVQDNARLIAAAPKLDNACNEVIDILEDAQGEWSVVQDVYAPEWTHPLKRSIKILNQALDEVRKKS